METSVQDDVEVGRKAPDFELRDQHGQPVQLSDFRGRSNVVIVFYPHAFTPTCTEELCALRDERGAFQRDDVAVLAISCDPMPALRVFAEQEGVQYSLLSDFWPHGATARAYGVSSRSAASPPAAPSSWTPRETCAGKSSTPRATHAAPRTTRRRLPSSENTGPVQRDKRAVAPPEDPGLSAPTAQWFA